LRSKGLVKQQSGNVVYIMPTSEARTLDPDLITEIIQINNAKAPDIAEVLSSSKSSGDDNRRNQSTGISQHGMLTVDPNQNLLIVRDTPEQMKIIRELITRLDKPLRQVVIKAQIVVTTEEFNRNLGAKWGVKSGNKAGLGGAGTGWSGSGSDIWGGGTLAGTGSSIGLSILRKSFNADLEINAMQSNNLGEKLASPTLMTTDRQEAYINQGKQIPYTVGSANEGYTTEFVEALMELKVTPSITPDDNIIMDIQIKKDDPSPIQLVENAEAPPIDKKEIKTQAIVRDGETVVLGGIYTVDKEESLSKVPFLGDLPFVGALFRNKNNSNVKAEMVIFLTPHIVK